MLVSTLKNSYLIHLFSLIHALVAMVLFYCNIPSRMVLTLLTITLITLIGLKNHVSTDFIAASVILANIFGYFIGMYLADLLSLIPLKKPYEGFAATFITTELLGWTSYICSKVFKHEKEDDRMRTKKTQWFILFIFVLFVIRIVYDAFFSRFPAETNLELLKCFFQNPLSMIVVICMSIISLHFLHNHMEWKSGTIILFTTGFILSLTGMSLLAMRYSLRGSGQDVAQISFIHLFLLCSVITTTIYTMTFIIYNSIVNRLEMTKALEEEHAAKYRYMKLKEQLNPHFLFNSLNVLDCLLKEHKDEQASTYIHKLAGIYRYMISNEEENTVTVQEELEFVDMYVDLLKVRFPEGFRIEREGAEKVGNKRLVPCSVQLLIENAFKHNRVGKKEPLVIHMDFGERHVTVSNNLQPKFVQSTNSTKRGLKYINHQYLDLVGKQIQVNHTETEYEVFLPYIE